MTYSDEELEGFAGLVEYEVGTLFGQVEQLMQRPRNPLDPVYLALVEAPLVHLRLLDDFLGCDLPKPRSYNEDDVVARHFLDDWRPERFLTNDERDAINAQLQHLVGRRTVGADWYFGRLLRAFGERFLEFVNQLAGADEVRADWFDGSVEWCWLVIDAEEAQARFPLIPAHGS